MITKEIKAVIFDVDNTLLATDEFVVRNIQNTITRLKNGGVFVNELSLDLIRAVQAKNMAFEDIFKELFVGQLNGRELWEVVLENYREHAKNEKYAATIGALEAVQTLKNLGIVVGLVTNRVKMLAERLEQAGFNTADFAFMCIPPSPEYKKPHPRAFEEAITQLRSVGIEPEQTVMFGDHPDDYYSSFYQNIKFVGVLQGQTAREDFLKICIENNLIVESLNDVGCVLLEVIKTDRYKKSLFATSALDGRHGAISYPLRHYFSEYALHKYRVKAEIEHLICLSEFFDGQVVRLFTEKERCGLRNLYQNFSEHRAYEILQYDHLGRSGRGPVEHDIKACELWLGEKFVDINMADVIPKLHLFVTSEDINNLAYKIMLNDSLRDLFVPSVVDIADRLSDLAEKHTDCPLLGRTHLQPASPTTFGKVFAGYLVRLMNSLIRLREIKLTGKINGAVGNYNSFVSTFPDLDWFKYSQELTGRLDLECELWTDQRGTHTDMVAKLQAVQEIGNVLRDLSQDISLYCAFGIMHLAKVDSHAGSSVMPHKINPWFAEVAEGNIKKANALFNVFSAELDVSRLQRDLSDHDLERSYGEAVGYVFVAIRHVQSALGLLVPDIDFARTEISQNSQVITEAMQTILRKHGCDNAYEIIKKESRGKFVTLEDLRQFVVNLDVGDAVKQEILSIMHPEEYVGLAVKLAKEAVKIYKENRERLTV